MEFILVIRIQGGLQWPICDLISCFYICKLKLENTLICRYGLSLYIKNIHIKNIKIVNINWGQCWLSCCLIQQEETGKIENSFRLFPSGVGRWRVVWTSHLAEHSGRTSGCALKTMCSTRDLNPYCCIQTKQLSLSYFLYLISLWSKGFFFFCCFGGRHTQWCSGCTSGCSRLWVQGSLQAALGTLWGPVGEIWVDCVQGRRPPWCTISLSIMVFLSSKILPG